MLTWEHGDELEMSFDAVFFHKNTFTRLLPAMSSPNESKSNIWKWTASGISPSVHKISAILTQNV